MKKHYCDDTAIAESVRELIEELKQAVCNSETAETYIVACSDDINNDSELREVNMLQVYWAREATETALATAKKVENMLVEIEHNRRAQT